MSSQQQRAKDVDWPPHLAEKYIPPEDRQETSKFDVTRGKAIKGIRREMERLGVDEWGLSTALPIRKSDGLPYATAAEPDDSCAVLEWTKDGDPFVVGCAKYAKVRDNLREIGLYIKEKRKMANRPVATGDSEFATARLPSADDDSGVTLNQPPHEILEVAPDASDSVVEAVYNEKVSDVHPDQGGDRDEFIRLTRAKEKMLGDR